MFEEEKKPNKRAWAFKVFTGFPWAVRAYLHLLIIFLLSIIVMTLFDSQAEKAVFAPVIEKMVGFIELVVGAVIGALSVATRQKEPAGK